MVHGVCMCVHVCVCARVRVCTCVHVCINDVYMYVFVCHIQVSGDYTLQPGHRCHGH